MPIVDPSASSEASEVGEGPETENGVAANLITPGAADWDNTFEVCS